MEKKKSRKKPIVLLVCIGIIALLIFGVSHFYFKGFEKTLNYIIYVNQTGVGEREDWTTEFISYDNAKKMIVVDDEYVGENYYVYGKRIPKKIHMNSITEVEITWAVTGGIQEKDSNKKVGTYSGEIETTCVFSEGKWHVTAVESNK